MCITRARSGSIREGGAPAGAPGGARESDIMERQEFSVLSFGLGLGYGIFGLGTQGSWASGLGLQDVGLGRGIAGQKLMRKSSKEHGPLGRSRELLQCFS